MRPPLGSSPDWRPQPTRVFAVPRDAPRSATSRADSRPVPGRSPGDVYAPAPNRRTRDRRSDALATAARGCASSAGRRILTEGGRISYRSWSGAAGRGAVRAAASGTAQRAARSSWPEPRQTARKLLNDVLGERARAARERRAVDVPGCCSCDSVKGRCHGWPKYHCDSVSAVKFSVSQLTRAIAKRSRVPRCATCRCEPRPSACRSPVWCASGARRSSRESRRPVIATVDRRAARARGRSRIRVPLERTRPRPARDHIPNGAERRRPCSTRPPPRATRSGSARAGHGTARLRVTPAFDRTLDSPRRSSTRPSRSSPRRRRPPFLRVPRCRSRGPRSAGRRSRTLLPARRGHPRGRWSR